VGDPRSKIGFVPPTRGRPAGPGETTDDLPPFPAASPRRLGPSGSSTRVALQAHALSAGHGDVALHVRVRVVALRGELDGAFASAAIRLAGRFGPPDLGAATLAPQFAGPLRRREWESGALRRLRSPEPFLLKPRDLARLLAASVPATPGAAGSLERHLVVFGSSGSGKTGYLARLCLGEIRAGRAVVVFDVHGDLSALLFSRLDVSEKERTVALDAGGAEGTPVGIRVLGAAPPGHREREASHVVAILRRLSSEGSELYWGFRLERIFDSFVRLAQEEGGGLGTVLSLLTDPRRRETARLATRRPELARFLEELPALERRNPEFLWPAASRLSKLALDRRLAALLDPPELGLPVESLLSCGRSLVLRLPIGELGPEVSGLAASLIAGRVYLALSARASVPTPPTVTLVVDEAQALSPRLLSEILSEGRKFGVGLVLATQYPERLSPELRSGAAVRAGFHRPAVREGGEQSKRLGGGEPDPGAGLGRRRARHAEQQTGEQAHVWNEVGVPLARGCVAFAAGDYDRASGLLQPILADVPCVGGSDEQRGVFAESHLVSLIRAGHRAEARDALSEHIA
ncbi:MAG: helicase HerA domain-containing protein, partial [Solirubrobacterales bacterium]